MNRGDHLETIFKNEKDRVVFIKTLEEACVSAGWKRIRSRVGMRWLAGQRGFKSMGTLSYGLWQVRQRLETDRNIRRDRKLLQPYNPKA